MRSATSSPRLVFTLFCAFLAVTATDAAYGDVLHLRNGKTIEGRVKFLASGEYHVVVEEGREFTISESEVEKHVRGEAPIDEMRRRLEKIEASDRDALVELAGWAEERGLRRSTLEIYRRILRLDPHHAGARNRLGYVLYKNRWYPRRELEGEGLVRFRGLWMAPEEVEQIRAKEAVEELRALLRDVHSKNPYLRQNAMAQVVENRDPRLVPYLRQLVKGQEPTERLLAARVLGNHSFSDGSRPVYEALLAENRAQVRTVLIYVLRSWGDGRIASWAEEDLTIKLGEDATAVRNLIALFEACPHRDGVPALIDLVDHPAWGRLADTVLRKTFDEPSRNRASWSRFWAANSQDYPADLGKKWLKRRKS